MARSPISRRNFIGNLAVVGAGFTVVPRHVLGRGFVPPSDRLDIAFIGAGGRGRQNLDGVAATGENVYALCDVDQRMAEGAYNAYPAARRYTDFREMLARDARGIDAVVVSTPDHTHAVAAIAAMRAGKHVYVEKPLARTIHETRTMIDQARRTRVITQMGNQGHAGDGTRLIRELVEAGAIGTVREVEYWTNRPIWPQAIERPVEAFNAPPTLDWDLWLGPAPERPYAPAYAPFRWRGWWDFGTGALGDIACHAMDAAFWTLDLGTPRRIEAESTRVFPETAPRASRVVYEFAERPAAADRPARGPIRIVWRDGELAPPRPSELPPQHAWPNYTNDGWQLWTGTDGKLIADIYGGRVLLLDEARQRDVTASPPPQRYPRVPNVHAEWIQAIKDRRQPGSSIAEYSGPLTEMVLLGNLAIRLARPIELSAGRITSPEVPEELVRPSYRRGWIL